MTWDIFFTALGQLCFGILVIGFFYFICKWIRGDYDRTPDRNINDRDPFFDNITEFHNDFR